MTSPVRVRIAPSPTGNLHLGTARTALYNYLFARHHKGTFVFRLEDTDEERSHAEYTKDIVDGLHWLGLNWDEGPDIGGPYAPYSQMPKVDHYSNIANQLIAKGLAYLSYETADELAALREEQKNAKKPPRYDNRGRHLTESQIKQYEKEGRVPSIRFKIEEPRVVTWNDLVKGEITIDSTDLGGDMVIVKSNGVATYNFAVIVDDVDMKITHVLRGEDHIHNTAKQILLYEALGAKPPLFGHTALIFDTEKAKLSKRKHGEAVHIDRYRLDGYMPEAMINYLAQMSWTAPDGREFFTLEEGAALFDLDRVSKSPAIFDIGKLNWFNSHYIRSLPLALITERALPFLAQHDLTSYDRKQLEELVEIVRPGLTTLAEIGEAVSFFFGTTLSVPQDLQETVLSTASARQVIDKCLANLNQLPWGDHPGCKTVIDSIGKDLGLKGKELYWPLRAVLSGKVKGPDLGAILSVLGEKRVRARLESALPLCRSV
jgi:glutamyl-tRNA synthetase